MPPSHMRKRIVVCCDGTWQNSDNGYVKASKKHPVPSLQIPSNVTRISRCFKTTCSDGTFQIIYYQSGVGSNSGALDRLFGGAFGVGISENIREAYAFVCANYVDGDEIVLLGFSRGAFTARSVGGMISDLGLLTRDGMDYFYPIFKDMQNWSNDKYDDPFPTTPFSNKPKGDSAASIYREQLVEKGYSRVKENMGQGDLIRVLAIGVWDTVGSLGIPDVEILSRLGVKRSTHEYQFYNTHLSNRIQHGFHALALDETRGPFSPTLWERRPQEQGTSDLRQVWFPGSHGNIGGGWSDQGFANTTLAWMMDQLSSVGCEFRHDALDRLFEVNVNYYRNLGSEGVLDRYAEKCGTYVRCAPKRLPRKPPRWAEKTIFESNNPIRPWALHAIQSAQSPLYNLVGSVTRGPGMYRKINPKTGRPLPEFLEDTNERVHSSVRVRLACEGLGLNDSDLWRCPSLLKYWRPRRVSAQFFDPVSQTAERGPQGIKKQPSTMAPLGEGQGNPTNPDSVVSEDMRMLNFDPSKRWVWEYTGPKDKEPAVKMMVEENLGPFERRLLELAAGRVHVYKYAENRDVNEFKVFHHRGFRKLMKDLHKMRMEQSKKAKKSAHEETNE
ncbi:hypothetical protein F5Y19DRAFT_135490 [Xylariaceae sp. FL1651]|nr:hypothetical protein F5Y19DRAFT_135490 [Xylariaceae sp. FL1651]